MKIKLKKTPTIQETKKAQRKSVYYYLAAFSLGLLFGLSPLVVYLLVR